MRLITTIAEMKTFRRELRNRSRSVGFVPTMGALHEGHLSLVRQAKRQVDSVVVSIFVNPIQFGPDEDLTRYPQDLEKDLEILTPHKVEAVFAPSRGEIYAEGFGTTVNPGEVAALLEGVSRPGHFRGVSTIIIKLFNIVQPDIAYFGQKDFQQALVVRSLVEDLNLDVRFVICPVARDADGVAFSSRNNYLNAEERQAARALYQSLRRAEEIVQGGEPDARHVLAEMKKVFDAEPRAGLEYATIVEPGRLEPVGRVTPGCVALVAARVGSARLIDNLIFGPEGSSPEMRLQLALTARPILDHVALVPGFETDAVRLKIAGCRDCAALSTIVLPPREFLSKYVKDVYIDLNAPRIAVIGRAAPANTDHFLYRNPQMARGFVAELYNLIGVGDFAQFRSRFVLTDAVRCHATGPHVAEKALGYCAKHLRAELNLFPNLETLIVLGDDAYLQFQRFILGRSPNEIKPFAELLGTQGWAREEVRLSLFGEREMRVFYCFHPTLGYKRSPSIADMIA